MPPSKIRRLLFTRSRFSVWDFQSLGMNFFFRCTIIKYNLEYVIWKAIYSAYIESSCIILIVIKLGDGKHFDRSCCSGEICLWLEHLQTNLSVSRSTACRLDSWSICKDGYATPCPEFHYVTCNDTYCPDSCTQCEPGYACRGGKRYQCEKGTFSDGNTSKSIRK